MNILPKPEGLICYFFPQSENGMLLTDSSEKILWINPAACRILDNEENDILQKKAASFGLHRNISNTALIKKQNCLEITVSTKFMTKNINRIRTTGRLSNSST